MSDFAIQARQLSKSYQLGSAVAYGRFSELLVHLAKAPFRAAAGRKDKLDNTLWALKDVDFEIRPGEVVGIIGRNGAGKSTLLKILSRITEPTTGQVRMKGRVGSLLEVGTGFHPELTGRENIFLNGAILGMTRAEIRSKFDAIVDFSEIESFLDTPVKRFSSGMYMRLAFAVAAHLEPEIMLVDEVLAVGDIAFQKKCLGKMDEVAKGGRTVLFVSHNMAAIQNLCSRALLLDKGHLIDQGDTDQVVNHYISMVSDDAASRYVCDKPPSQKAWIAAARLLNRAGNQANNYLMTEPMSVEIELHIKEPLSYTLGIQIKEMNNSPVYHFSTTRAQYELPREPGGHIIRCELPPLHLYPGQYTVRLQLSQMSAGAYDQQHVVGNLIFSIEQDHRVTSFNLGRPAGLIFQHEAKWSCQTSNAVTGQANETTD